MRFDYTRRDGEASARLVQPLQLVSVGHRWYLVAWDVRRADWRTFRIDRMEEPRLGGVRFEPKELPGGSAAEFVVTGLKHAIAHPRGDDRSHPGRSNALPRCGTGTALRWPWPATGHRRLWLRSESLDWLAGMVAIFSTLFDVTIVDAPEEAVAMLADGAGRLDAATR